MRRKATVQLNSEMTSLERLHLRVSAMINHPIAQQQRWVTIRRLDMEGDSEWEEMLTVLSETDALDMFINNDGTVMLEWGVLEDDDPTVELYEDIKIVGDETAPS